MAPRLAWIGLGNMGRGMCKNLVEKGNLSSPLILYNRTQARSDKLSSQLDDGKTKVATSIAEVVKGSDIIFTCVGDDAAINETVDAILAEDVAGKLIVDCSTVHPETTDELAKKITSKGAEFVACPGMFVPRRSTRLETNFS
jgi:3-hydroxyisobutyrate dehydrogenase-like beta-hydroxyacid dehydrogenase